MNPQHRCQLNCFGYLFRGNTLRDRSTDMLTYPLFAEMCARNIDRDVDELAGLSIKHVQFSWSCHQIDTGGEEAGVPLKHERPGWRPISVQSYELLPHL